jgi:peptidoglycan/LPS O-acetylase OafA/YrhL
MNFKKHTSKILFITFSVSLFSNIPSVNEFVPYGVFIPYFSQFYIGIIVYHILYNVRVINGSGQRVLVVLLCASIAFFCAYSYSELLPLSFSALVGSIFIVLHKYDQRLCSNLVARPFLLIGTFSYSLYLLHIPLWPFVGQFTRNFVPLPSFLSAPLVLVPGIIILSFFWYLFFEEPQSLQKTGNRMSTPFRTIRSGMVHILAITNLRRI